MIADDILTIVQTACAELPETVQMGLDEVTILVVDNHKDETLPDDMKFPEDFRGCYVGTVVTASDEPEDNTGDVQLPVGTIYLNAENLVNQDEVLKTLYHEIGHVLGLSESDVSDLGMG